MSPETIKCMPLPFRERRQELIRHRDLAPRRRVVQRRDTSAFDRKQGVLRVRACARG